MKWNAVTLPGPPSRLLEAKDLGIVCCEVSSLDPFVVEPSSEERQAPSKRLRHWPEVWQVVIYYGFPDFTFAVGRPHTSLDAAEQHARHEFAELKLFNEHYPQPAIYDGAEESWCVLFGPLTRAAFEVLCDPDRSTEKDFEALVLNLQAYTAWELTRTAALALKHLPPLVQKTIFAFAFTERALRCV